LAVTDTRRLKARLSELEADLESARAARQERWAEARFAKSDFEALANSYKRKAVSEQEYRRARAAHEVASAKVSAAAEAIQSIRSRIEHLQVQIEDATIRAPFDARVVQQHAEPGEWVRPGDPIVTLVSTGRVEAWLEVPERHIARLAGSVETITLKTAGAAATRQSTSARVVPQIDQRVRTFALVAELEDRDGTLVPGMSVTAWVPTSAASAFLTVPKDAIIRRDGATYVYRVVQAGDGEQADQRPVQVLFHFGSRVALATGNALKQSDRVIVEGNERLLPGDTVAAVSIDKESDDNKSTPGLEEQDQGDELARATGQERRTTVNN
jgi:RND family efflux transporter MFP subunit